MVGPTLPGGRRPRATIPLFATVRCIPHAPLPATTCNLPRHCATSPSFLEHWTTSRTILRDERAGGRRYRRADIHARHTRHCAYAPGRGLLPTAYTGDNFACAAGSNAYHTTATADLHPSTLQPARYRRTHELLLLSTYTGDASQCCAGTTYAREGRSHRHSLRSASLRHQTCHATLDATASPMDDNAHDVCS